MKLAYTAGRGLISHQKTMNFSYKEVPFAKGLCFFFLFVQMDSRDKWLPRFFEETHTSWLST
jgi:hypothetical protein